MVDRTIEANAAGGPQEEENAMEHEERTEQRRYLAARRRVQELRSFYHHALIYVLVNAALATLNLLTDPDELWFIYPMGGWGIGLAIHALTTFGMPGFLGPEWERRKIARILAAEEKRGGR